MSARQGLLSCYLREWVDIIPMDKVLPCMDYRMRQAVCAPRKITWEDLSRSLSPSPSPLGLPLSLFINAMISTPGASDTVFENNGICGNFTRGIKPYFFLLLLNNWAHKYFKNPSYLYSYINVLLIQYMFTQSTLYKNNRKRRLLSSLTDVGLLSMGLVFHSLGAEFLEKLQSSNFLLLLLNI